MGIIELCRGSLKCPKQDQRIDISKIRMPQPFRNPPNDFKAQAAPQTNRARVAFQHEVELHRAIASCSRVAQGMLAHLPRNAPPVRRLMGDIAAVGNMRAAPAWLGRK